MVYRAHAWNVHSVDYQYSKYRSCSEPCNGDSTLQFTNIKIICTVNHYTNNAGEELI